MSIQAMTNLPNITLLTPSSQTQFQSGNASLFNQTLDAVQGMADNQATSKSEMMNVLMGNSDNTQGALIDTEKAELQMSLFTVVRDKVAQDYNQIINMQI